jgi:ribosome-binding factor A
MGTATEQKRALEGLNHASGFLQARIAARLQTRFTPILSFKLDESVKKSIELGRLIDQAVASDQRPTRPSNEPLAGSEPETHTGSVTGEATDLEHS